MNEGATVIMSWFPTLTFTQMHTHTDLKAQKSHTYAQTLTNTHTYTAINRQLIYKWADLCVGLALR